MGLLKPLAGIALGTACLTGCGMRDLSAPIFPTGPDSAAIVKTGPQKTAKDTAHVPVITIRIESLSASDLRMDVGETKPAAITVLPLGATSPLYEMTSSKPGVAEVTPTGIRGAKAGSATITVHALDGSEKTTKFHVIVDAIADACVLLPCLCVVAAAKQGGTADGNGNGNGQGKSKEKGQNDAPGNGGGCPD
jgi:hypothetical protein